MTTRSSFRSLSARVSAVVVLGLAALAAACTPRGGGEQAGGGDDFRGRLLVEPRPKPDFVLTDTEGRPFDFREQTRGYVTLVFFGYTYCPDVCPVHMANLGAVLDGLRPSISRYVKVVFVTTDPERDTPERLRTWLDNFDSDFVGLTGPLDSVNIIQQSMGLPPAMHGEPDSLTGFYPVGHSASVVAFTPDGMQRLVYPFGTRQADWAHDIPRLVEEQWDGS